METATAATAAALGLHAGRRLRELAAQLNLHRGFADVVASLEAGHGGTLGGVWGSSRALVAAALVESCPGPLVIVAPHPGEIDAIARDLALFSDVPVAKFPAWEAEPGERVLYDEIFGERLRVLKGLGDCPLFSTTSLTFEILQNEKRGLSPRRCGFAAQGGQSPFPNDVDRRATSSSEKGDSPRPRHQHSEFVATGAGARRVGHGDARDSCRRAAR